MLRSLTSLHLQVRRRSRAEGRAEGGAGGGCSCCRKRPQSALQGLTQPPAAAKQTIIQCCGASLPNTCRYGDAAALRDELKGVQAAAAAAADRDSLDRRRIEISRQLRLGQRVLHKGRGFRGLICGCA